MSNRTYYGKLGVAKLPSEVLVIWYSRDDELDPDPSWKWSWEHEGRHDDIVERRDYVCKILEAAPLTDRELEALTLCCIEDWTFEDVGNHWGVSRERARQVYERALREVRKHSSKITNVPSWEIDPTVTTWSWWSLTQRSKRRRNAA